MRRIDVDAAAFDGTIEIGKQGEDIATDVVFDCGKWLEEIAEQSGVLSLAFQRPKDTIAAEVVTVDVTETTLVWHVNEIHLENDGIGYAEIRYTSGGKFKSRTFLVFVQHGLSTAFAPNNYEPIPEPPQDGNSYELVSYKGNFQSGYKWVRRSLELNVVVEEGDVQQDIVYNVEGATKAEFEEAIVSSVPIFVTFPASGLPCRTQLTHFCTTEGAMNGSTLWGMLGLSNLTTILLTVECNGDALQAWFKME